MDWQMFINLIAGAFLSILGWFARVIYDSVETLKNDVNAIRIDLPQNYVRKIDLDTRLIRIESVLDKIFDKLDQKADK